MKLDLFDSYNIRVRLSSSIIIFAPLVLTVFLCFDELFSFISSSVLVAILLAFTNCLPIFQRYICQKRVAFKNYAVEFLLPHDNTLNPVTKKRYYNILVKTNVAFAAFQSPNDSEGFRQCCESAVRYLREKTRNSPLVIEENINYGFYKTLVSCKPLGIVSCIVLGLFVAIYSLLYFKNLSLIPMRNYLAFSFNIILLIFWIFGIRQSIWEDTAKQYAKTLLSAIDSL
jgi:hypothetical protein